MGAAMSQGAAGPTDLLLAWGRGDAAARDALIPLVEAELRQMARRYMAGEKRQLTLQATALVNETYLRLVQIDRVQWRDRTHFFAVAARVMRRILVDAARARQSDKRWGQAEPVTLDESSLVTPGSDLDLLALDGALDDFRAAYPRQCDVVELRYFGGLNLDETAETLAVSRDTVKRDWRFARLWLLRALRGISAQP